MKWLKRWFKRKELKLTADDFYFANISEYLDRKPYVKNELIKSERESKPKDCLSCVFFKWIEAENFHAPNCALIGQIKGLEFYDQRAEGCVLDE